MISSARQAEAIAYVQARKHCVFAAAKRINKRFEQQDMDDLMSEGFVIVLEILAAGKMDQLEDLFWPKLERSIWESYDFLMDYDDCEESDENGNFRPSPILAATSSSDPAEHVQREKEFESATSSVLDFLSPNERKILCLVLGLTARGACAVAETSRILGISRLAVRTSYGRIIKKVLTAKRSTSKEGWLILSRGKPRGRGSHLVH